MFKPNDTWAFPVTSENGVGHGDPGMTLRDWFAGQALSAGVSTEAKEYELQAWFGRHATGITGAEIAAARAYEIADAMLKRRAR